MSDNLTIDYIGDYNRILTALETLPQKARGRIVNRLQQSAQRVYDVSQREVPRDSEDLANSGHVEPGTDDSDDFLMFAVVYGDGNATQGYDYGDYVADGYAWFQELGTRFMRSHPYLGPAFEEEAQKLLTRLGNIIDSYSSDDEGQ
jgi:hypothetical protein